MTPRRGVNPPYIHIRISALVAGEALHFPYHTILLDYSISFILHSKPSAPGTHNMTILSYDFFLNKKESADLSANLLFDRMLLGSYRLTN